MSISEPFCTIYIPHMNEDGFCSWDNIKRDKDNTYTCKSGDKFHYPSSFFFKNVITEFDLVCNDYSSNLIFSSVSAIGSFVGCIVMSFFADWRGRRLAILVSMVTMSSGAILETYMQTFSKFSS